MADGNAAIASPSGNIGCDFDPAAPGCGVLSVLTSHAEGVHDRGDGLWWVTLVDTEYQTGVPKRMPRGDAPLFEQEPGVRVLQYGQVGYYREIVCASERVGMTCWNSSTGHGVFMNKSRMDPF